MSSNPSTRNMLNNITISNSKAELKSLFSFRGKCVLKRAHFWKVEISDDGIKKQ